MNRTKHERLLMAYFNAAVAYSALAETHRELGDVRDAKRAQAKAAAYRKKFMDVVKWKSKKSV